MSSRPMLPEAEVMRIDLGGMVPFSFLCSPDSGDLDLVCPFDKFRRGCLGNGWFFSLNGAWCNVVCPMLAV
jgi:hypothetical protein